MFLTKKRRYSPGKIIEAIAKHVQYHLKKTLNDNSFSIYSTKLKCQYGKNISFFKYELYLILNQCAYTVLKKNQPTKPILTILLPFNA